MITEFGKFLRIIRINSGDSARDMAAKLNMSPSYLSTIENGKRNIPPEMESLLIRAYDLSERDIEKLRKAIAASSESVRIDLSDLEERKRHMIFEISKGDLDDDTIDQLCKIINDKKGERKMFGKKNHTVGPRSVHDDVIIQISESEEITKKTKITVPTQYKAIAFIDNRPAFRIDPCIEKDFVKSYGKEYLGAQLKIAFISSRTLAQSAWGFGNIQVNNERLKEAYRIGANGKFSVEITDYVKTIQVFPRESLISLELIREKTISTMKTVGVPIVAEYFSNTSVSVFEMSSLISDFREKFMTALQNEKIFADMGIRISDLTVDGFHVNEDDLKVIRDRINS